MGPTRGQCKARQKHYQRLRQRLHERSELPSEHPLFPLPPELQLNTFRDHYFDTSTHKPIIRLCGTLRRNKPKKIFTLTEVDRAILASSNHAAAIWLDAFVDWFDRNVRVVIDFTAFNDALYSESPAPLLSQVRALVAKSLRRSLLADRPCWEQLCPKLRSLPTHIRNLEYTIDYLPLGLLGGDPTIRSTFLDELNELQDLLTPAFAPGLERLHLKIPWEKPFWGTVTAMKHVLAENPALDGLAVVFICDFGTNKKELKGVDLREAKGARGTAAAGRSGCYHSGCYHLTCDRPDCRGRELMPLLVSACRSGLERIVLELED